MEDYANTLCLLFALALCWLIHKACKEKQNDIED